VVVAGDWRNGCLMWMPRDIRRGSGGSWSIGGTGWFSGMILGGGVG
jgi:hypothetical protein